MESFVRTRKQNVNKRVRPKIMLHRVHNRRITQSHIRGMIKPHFCDIDTTRYHHTGDSTRGKTHE